MAESEPLHARLSALRTDALRQLAEADGIDTGMLRLVADAGAVLAMLDDEAVDAETALLGERVVLSDDGNRAVLTLYHESKALAAVELAPRRALQLAGELLAVSSVRRIYTPSN